MKNKKSKIIIILLIILVIGLSSYIVYDKLIFEDVIKESKKKEDETTGKENNNKENNISNNKEQYTFSDFSGKVFQKKDGSGDNYLVLWDNGNYRYKGKLGNYIVNDKIIKLNYIFENNKTVTKEKYIELIINSEVELIDKNENITLIKVNHPTSPGGNDFYTAINS